MNDVEKLIAKLVDEHKINGEEAIILIKAVNQIDQNKSSTIDDLLKIRPTYKDNALDSRYQYPYQQNSITGISDGTTTVTY